MLTLYKVEKDSVNIVLEVGYSAGGKGKLSKI